MEDREYVTVEAVTGECFTFTPPENASWSSVSLSEFSTDRKEYFMD